MMQKLLLSITLVIMLGFTNAYPKGNWERNSDGVHMGHVKKAQHEYDAALNRRQTKEEQASLAMQEANKAAKEAVDKAEALVQAAQEKLACAQRALDSAQKELDDALENASNIFKRVRTE